MIPKKDFLQKVIGQFEDPNMAFVQTPQTFYNADIYQYNLHGKYYNEQDFFMRCIEPARNSKDAVLHIGTNAVFRRAYVNNVGGYPTSSITEDMALGLKLQAQGYTSTFINEPLAVGSSALNLKDLVKQRDRWCRGNLQVIKDFKKEFKKKLNFKQKMIYLDGVLYWFTGATKMIFLLMPIIHILTGIPIIDYDRLYLIPLFYILFFGQILLSKRILPKKISKNYLEFFYKGNIYNTVMAPHLTYSILKHFFFSDIKFSVTNKKINQEKGSFSFKYIWCSFVLLILHIVTIFFAIKNFIGNRLYVETFFINVFWLIYNVPCLFVAVKLGYQKPRAQEYMGVDANAKLYMYVNSQKIIGKINKISTKGIKMYIPPEIKISKDDDIKILMDKISIPTKIKKIEKNDEIELSFLDDISFEQQVAISQTIVKYVQQYEDNLF